MGLKCDPEIKLARKIHEKHNLSIPFNLHQLVSLYATVHHRNIPIEGVDGVCINLKIPNKPTKIIVNSSTSTNRRRFTLAHELGHVIIPWHLGTIVDDLNPSQANSHYTKLEREANRFASELLMPFSWLIQQFLVNNDLNNLITQTCRVCEVSEAAAKIRINRFWDEAVDFLLPPNTIIESFNKTRRVDKIQESLVQKCPFHPLIVANQIVNSIEGKVAFCIEENQSVIGCGSTNLTHHFYQSEGDTFNPNPYPFFTNHFVYQWEDVRTHWWDLDVIFDFPEDQRSWQALLTDISNDLVPPDEVRSFKARINGVIAGTHGNWKKRYPETTEDAFANAIIAKFNNHADADIIRHPSFLPFVKKRCQLLYKPQR